MWSTDHDIAIVPRALSSYDYLQERTILAPFVIHGGAEGGAHEAQHYYHSPLLPQDIYVYHQRTC